MICKVGLSIVAKFKDESVVIPKKLLWQLSRSLICRIGLDASSEV